MPESTSTHKYVSKRIYNLHRQFDNTAITAGSGAYEVDGLCPLFSSTNPNMFAATFGIECETSGTTFVRPISSYEYTKCFRLTNDLTYSLSHPENFGLLTSGIPAKTGRLFLNSVLLRLDNIRNESFEVFDPSLQHAPTTVSMVPAFTQSLV